MHAESEKILKSPLFSEKITEKIFSSRTTASTDGKFAPFSPPISNFPKLSFRFSQILSKFAPETARRLAAHGKMGAATAKPWENGRKNDCRKPLPKQ